MQDKGKGSDLGGFFSKHIEGRGRGLINSRDQYSYSHTDIIIIKSVSTKILIQTLSAIIIQKRKHFLHIHLSKKTMLKHNKTCIIRVSKLTALMAQSYMGVSKIGQLRPYATISHAYFTCQNYTARHKSRFYVTIPPFSVSNQNDL